MVKWLVQESTHPVSCGFFFFCLPLKYHSKWNFESIHHLAVHHLSIHHHAAQTGSTSDEGVTGEGESSPNCTYMILLLSISSFTLELTLELRIFFLIGNKKTDPQDADFCMVIKVLGSWCSFFLRATSTEWPGHQTTMLQLTDYHHHNHHYGWNCDSLSAYYVLTTIINLHNNSHKGGLLSPF